MWGHDERWMGCREIVGRERGAGGKGRGTGGAGRGTGGAGRGAGGRLLMDTVLSFFSGVASIHVPVTTPTGKAS